MCNWIKLDHGAFLADEFVDSQRVAKDRINLLDSGSALSAIKNMKQLNTFEQLCCSSHSLWLCRKLHVSLAGHTVCCAASLSENRVPKPGLGDMECVRCGALLPDVCFGLLLSRIKSPESSRFQDMGVQTNKHFVFHVIIS